MKLYYDFSINRPEGFWTKTLIVFASNKTTVVRTVNFVSRTDFVFKKISHRSVVLEISSLYFMCGKTIGVVFIDYEKAQYNKIVETTPEPNNVLNRRDN